MEISFTKHLALDNARFIAVFVARSINFEVFTEVSYADPYKTPR